MAVQKADKLGEQNKKQLFLMFSEYKDVFSKIPSRIKRYEHEIKLRDYTPFRRSKTYEISTSKRSEAKRQIEKMMTWKVIEPGATEYVPPLVTVLKKDGSMRVCFDARYLNARMCKDHVMPPKLEDLIRLGIGQVMSSLDLTASYWQIPNRKEHQQYTVFLFQNTTYCFKVLPFSLATRIASFIRALTQVLGPEFESFTLTYVDDLLVFSMNVEEHLQHLKAVFEKLRGADLTVKLRKCKFARAEVNFLGHIIFSGGIGPE